MKTCTPEIVQALSAAAHYLGEAERLSADPESSPRKLHASIKRAAADARAFAESAHLKTDDAAPAAPLPAEKPVI